MTIEELTSVINGLSRSEKNRLACQIIEERMLDYFLVLDLLGIGGCNQELQKKAEDIVRSKALLYDRLNHIPINEIRKYANRLIREMQ